MLIMQNEKMVVEYLIETLNDKLNELEDKYLNLRKQYKRNYRDCELLKKDFEKKKKDFLLLQQTVKSKWELIEKNGLTILNSKEHFKENTINGNKVLTNGIKENQVLNSKKDDLIKINGDYIDDIENKKNINNTLNHTNGDHNLSNGHEKLICEEQTNGYIKLNNFEKNKKSESKKSSNSSLIFSDKLHQFLKYIDGNTLNDKIKFLLFDKVNKVQSIKSLKLNLDDERIKSIKLESLSLLNGNCLKGDQNEPFLNKGEDFKKTIESYKNELERLSIQMNELENTKSQLNKDILELQLRLQKMEETENELKTEKRKILREFRECQTKIEELDTENYHLHKRIDKLSKNSKFTAVVE